MTGLGSSCGACKFLRRKYSSECVFAPYFCYDQAPSHFAAVHKVFGASNVSKLLSHLPVHDRTDAAITISYEALARVQDPIYGCVAHIFALQQQVVSLKEEIETLENQMANLAVDFSGSCSSQTTYNPNEGLQLSSQLDEMNIEYLNQQNPLLSNSIEISANPTYQSQASAQFPPLYGWDDQSSHSYSDSNPSETLFERLDQSSFGIYPGIDAESNTYYYSG